MSSLTITRRGLAGLLVLAVAVSVAWLLSNGQTPAGTVFRTTIGQAGTKSLSVTLGDQTGLVTAIEVPTVIDSSFGVDTYVHADPFGSMSVLVGWATQGCDSGTTFSLSRAGDGYRLDLRDDIGLDRINACSDLLDIRELRISFSQGMRAESITIHRDSSS